MDLNEASDRGVVVMRADQVALLTILLVSRGCGLRLRVVDVSVTGRTVRQLNLHASGMSCFCKYSELCKYGLDILLDYYNISVWCGPSL